MRLGPLLLGTQNEEVHDHQNDGERCHLHHEISPRRNSGGLGIGWGDQEIHGRPVRQLAKEAASRPEFAGTIPPGLAKAMAAPWPDGLVSVQTPFLPPP